MKVWKKVVALLTGIWAMAIGFDFTRVLSQNEVYHIWGYLAIDWIPLLGLGATTTGIFLHELVEELKKGPHKEKREEKNER